MLKEDSLVQLFSKFIADFESKINPLSLVQLGMVALEQHSDSEQAIKFIERIGEKVNIQLDILFFTYNFLNGYKKDEFYLRVKWHR